MTTVEWLFEEIGLAKNKNAEDVKKHIGEIKVVISNYRITALNSKNFVKKWCEAEANKLEQRLKEILSEK